MRRFFAAALLTTLISTSAMARTMEDASIVVMRTIDKQSARTHTFEIPVDKTVKFGTSLFIKVRACRKSSPLDRPESAAFMQIWERKPSEKDAKWIFSGWMFASNPSLSAMDHPVYDVWVMECKNAATSAKPSEVFSSEATPEHAPAQDASSKPAVTPVVDTEAAPEAEDDEAAPDKPAATPAPAAPIPPAGKPPLVAVPDKPAPAVVTPAVPATQDVPPPAAKPSAMPPIDKLPGSFEDGNE